MRFHLILAIVLAACSSAATAQGRDHNLARNLAATCANCHGTNGRSVGAMPALAGQSRESIAKIMKEFKSGARSASIMHQIAKGYSDQQIDAIAAFLGAQEAK